MDDSSSQTPEAVELILADRVELASRIVRRCGEARSDVARGLAEPLTAAIAHLAEAGNPITQVKMMLACQNVRGIDLVGVLRKPLESPVRWVRAQAFILRTRSEIT